MDGITQVRVDYRKAMKKLEKVQLSAVKAGEATVKDLAKLGMTHAQIIAPFFSGRTASFITTKFGKGSNGPYATIIAGNPTKERSGGFNLVKWMHSTNGKGRKSYLSRSGHWYTSKTGPVFKKIKSGDPRFMYMTTAWLKSRAGAVAEGHYNKIKVK